MSFVKAVLAYMKGGDETKLKRFHKRVSKFLDDQIEILNREIEDIEDSFLDFDDRQKDAIFNIDVDRIKDIDDTKEFIPEYTDNIVSLMRERRELEELIDKKKVDISYFKELKKTIDEVEPPANADPVEDEVTQ